MFIERILLDLSYVATIGGFIYVSIQLLITRKEKKKEFEEQSEKEYREIIKNISYKVFLNIELDNDTHNETMNDYFRYIDFSNSQVELRKNKRISSQTWIDWQEGILYNFELKDFKKALNEIVEKNPSIFRELRYLLSTKSDPYLWEEKTLRAFIKKENEEKSGIV